MRDFFKGIFNYSKADRRAMVAIGCVAVFIVGVNCVVSVLRGEKDAASVVDQSAMDVFESEEEGDCVLEAAVLAAFDPNDVDSISLAEFGIEGYKIRNFLRYRAAGKIFFSAKDMGKTYGWTEDDVNKVESYVKVDESIVGGRRTENNSFVRNDVLHARRGRKNVNDGMYGSVGDRVVVNVGRSAKFNHLVRVDVNKADSATLCSIPGIGRGVSRAILNYRNRLGGLYAKEQLLEISIIAPEMLEWFEVGGDPELRMIDVNRASFAALNRHPYISYDQTKTLLDYVRLYGRIENERVLLSTGIFTADEVERLRPYLRYE